MRHAHLLGARDPLLVRLVPTLSGLMGQAYPELLRAEPLITEILRLEETRFKQTLDRGLRLLEDETGHLGTGQKLPGQVAFKLYDTYGFPLDLTQDVLRGQNREVDTAGFNKAMNRQREEARQAWKGSGEAATERLWFELRDRAGATEFLGYDTLHAEGIVTALIRGGEAVDEAQAGDAVQLLANQTPFYGESGGQTGDAGLISTMGGVRIRVTSTEKKLGVLFVHRGVLEGGTLTVGDAIDMRVDAERRDAIRANHSATHLLHEALRRRPGRNTWRRKGRMSVLTACASTSASQPE